MSPFTALTLALYTVRYDEFARKSRGILTPPRLRRLRHRIFVQPVGAVLVR
jgi:hypothetical protein